MDKQPSGFFSRILKHSLNERETIQDKLFQGFFKTLEIIATAIGVLFSKRIR